MGRTIGREWSRGPASWLVVSTALVVLASFFVVVGAQMASAAQCGRGTSVCHLVFDIQPHDAVTNTVITGTSFDPAAAKVQVEALDDANQLVTSFSGMVTLFINTPTSVPPTETVTLSGNSVPAVDGVATFENLKLSHSGTFTLRAESSAAASGFSTAFTVWDKHCTQGVPCKVSKTGSMTAEVNTSADGTYFLSLNADIIDCGDSFNHAPGTVTVDSTSAETKVLTITIDKSVVKEATPNNGVTSYQVCYQSETTTPRLLPNCPTMPIATDAPCVLSKSKDKAGSVIIRVLLPAGDPKVH